MRVRIEQQLSWQSALALKSFVVMGDNLPATAVERESYFVCLPQFVGRKYWRGARLERYNAAIESNDDPSGC